MIEHLNDTDSDIRDIQMRTRWKMKQLRWRNHDDPRRDKGFPIHHPLWFKCDICGRMFRAKPSSTTGDKIISCGNHD